VISQEAVGAEQARLLDSDQRRGDAAEVPPGVGVGLEPFAKPTGLQELRESAHDASSDVHPAECSEGQRRVRRRGSKQSAEHGEGCDAEFISAGLRRRTISAAEGGVTQLVPAFASNAV
jgi:hypothetical protein